MRASTCRLTELCQRHEDCHFLENALNYKCQFFGSLRHWQKDRRGRHKGPGGHLAIQRGLHVERGSRVPWLLRSTSSLHMWAFLSGFSPRAKRVLNPLLGRKSHPGEGPEMEHMPG